MNVDENNGLKKPLGRPAIFALGIFFIALAAYHIRTSGNSNATAFYLLIGCYNIWQEGFHKDVSAWKIKPGWILLLLLVLWAAFLFVMSALEKKKAPMPPKKKEPLIEQIVRKQQWFLPREIGEKDSLLRIIATDETTIEYIYKMNVLAKDLQEETKDHFILKANQFLKGQLDSLSPPLKRQLKQNHIGFCHRFLDRTGHAIMTINLDSSEF